MSRPSRNAPRNFTLALPNLISNPTKKRYESSVSPQPRVDSPPERQDQKRRVNELSQKKGKQERIVKQEPGEKRKKRKLIIVEADDDAPDSADLAQQQQLEFMEEEIPEKVASPPRGKKAKKMMQAVEERITQEESIPLPESIATAVTGAKRKERVAEQPREILEPIKELSEKAKGKRRMVEPIVESTKMGTAKIAPASRNERIEKPKVRTKVKTAVEVGVAVPPLDAAKINQKKDEAPIDEKAALPSPPKKAKLVAIADDLVNQIKCTTTTRTLENSWRPVSIVGRGEIISRFSAIAADVVESASTKDRKPVEQVFERLTTALRIALPSLLVPTNLKAPAASFAVDILPEEELEESLVSMKTKFGVVEEATTQTAKLVKAEKRYLTVETSKLDSLVSSNNELELKIQKRHSSLIQLSDAMEIGSSTRMISESILAFQSKNETKEGMSWARSLIRSLEGMVKNLRD